MMEDTTPMVPKGSSGKKTRIGTWFAIVFILGFGAALLAMGGLQWGKTCDQPMKIYLVLHGVAGVIASLFFLWTEVSFMDSKDPEDDGSLKGLKLQIFVVVCIYFLISGVIGSAWYFASEECENTAYTTFRWTWAAVLLFLIIASMMFSNVFGKLGGPIFAKIGHLFGSLFQALADLFNTMADVLEEGPADPENVPPKRSGAAVFALYVNHAAFLWFFLYIFFEAWKERSFPCDKPLRTYLYLFGIIGSAVTYAHFMYEMFAGVKTKAKLKRKRHIILGVLFIVTCIWGAVGFDWVHTSETCEEDGNAVNTYRLAYLLSCCFLVFLGMCGIFGCLGALDFLCSGKMRFVVVISRGDDDEDEDEN